MNQKLCQLKHSLEANPPDDKNGELILGYQITSNKYLIPYRYQIIFYKNQKGPS